VPSARSCAALLLITAGAVAYIACDREFRAKGVRAYFWASVWWAVLVFQLTYGKFLVTGIPLRSLWTPVLYTNSLSILPTLLVGVASGEFTRARLEAIELSPVGGSWLLLSCLVGIGISWSGFRQSPTISHNLPQSPAISRQVAGSSRRRRCCSP